MMKMELKSFRVFFGDGGEKEMQAPCLLSACGVSIEQETEGRAQRMERMMGAFAIEYLLEIPEQMLGYRGVVLSFCGLFGHCQVFLNGEMRAEWHSPPERVYLPLEKSTKPMLLRLFFPKRAVPSDVGLLGAAELIAYPNDIFTDIYTEQTHKNDKCELFIRAKTLHGVGSREAMATVYAPSGEIRYVGLMHGEGRLQLSSIHKYRPGRACAAGLYRVSVTLYEDGNPVDTVETGIGLRRLSFAKDGAPFSVEVDDEPFFVKAASISACPAPSAEESIACFENALPAFCRLGGNTLLVTGEEGFLSERVYSICDRLGLFVFQQLPAPPDPSCELSAYFADLKATVAPLSNHPSLALLLLPHGVSAQDALGRAIKGFFAFSFPQLAVRAYPESGLPSIASVPSMPGALAVRRSLPMEARRIFSYAMESAQQSPEQLISMLSTAAQDLPYGASLEDVCYITGVCSADHAGRALARVLSRGVPGGIVCGTLFEGGIAMKPALMDGLLQKKALYYDMKQCFAPIFMHAEAEAEGLSVTLATQGTGDREVQVRIRLLDRANNPIRSVQSEIVLSVGSPFLMKTALPEILSHEREYYAQVGVYAEGLLLCEKTVLFVPAKHFRFVYPNLWYEIKGNGKNYELTVSASAFVHRLQLSFTKTAAHFSKNYFDITSEGKVTLQIETEEVTTSRHLGTQLRLRSMYDVGRFSEQDLADEADIEL